MKPPSLIIARHNMLFHFILAIFLVIIIANLKSLILLILSLMPENST
jgi:hypothetical protein